MPRGVYVRKPKVKTNDVVLPRMSMTVTETDEQIDARLRERRRQDQVA
jgi:hypothetical protein